MTDNETRLIPSGFDRETALTDWADPRWEVRRKSTGLIFGVYNHWRFSAIWGWGTYCSVRECYPDIDSPLIRSPDAEVMPTPPGGVRIEIGGDTVAGNVPAAALYAALVAAHRDDQTAVVRALTRPYQPEGENE